MKNESKVRTIVNVAIAVVVLVAVAILVAMGSKDAVVNIRDDGIEFTGMYGLVVGYDEISGISLLENSMSELDYGRRVNGYGGIGQAAKGNFRSNTLGEILLFVQLDAAPTIHIERNDEKDVYISYGDEEATRALYARLEEAVQ